MANPVIDKFVNWLPDADGADSNQPTNATFMSDGQLGDLDGELRRIKSEIRQELTVKSWEKHKGLLSTTTGQPIAFWYGSATEFGLNDDWTIQVAQVGRRFVALSATGVLAYGAIASTYYQAPNSGIVCTLTYGALTAALTDVWLGPEVGSIPLPTTLQNIPHSALAGVTSDQHHPQLHKGQHTSGAGDAFGPTDIIDAAVRRIWDQVNPIVDFYNIPEGYLLIRSGGAITGTANIGGGQLRIAQASAAVSGAIDGIVGLNPRSFAPSFACSGGVTPSHQLITAAVGDDGTYPGRFGLKNIANANDTLVRWEYMTSTDDPTIWVAYDGSGAIKASWASDDPTAQPPLTIPACQSAMFKSADLSQLTISSQSLAQADAKIASENLNRANRLYRGLQFEANDQAPAVWIQQNCKVVAGELVMK